ncbi:protein XRI1-like [Durio zibethinus]|uniref:Protein XRI1-like n=1 Tax=Durio zibethinus TaxID=66656 RepID=A0A6P5XA89_DURZI|nr:protein XRI1-like [Durio zibethinus]
MAYSNSSLHSASLGWDLQNLGVLNADTSLVMDGTAPFFPHLDSDFSSGYLEDALLEFSERSKRRRLLLYSDHDQINGLNDLAKSYWNSSCNRGLSENFSCMSQLTSINGVSDDPLSTSVSSDEANIVTEMKKPEEAIPGSPGALDSSSSSYKGSVKTRAVFNKDPQLSTDPISSSGSNDKKKKRVITRVVYPFALVKPGGIEGNMTLDDINQRILMPPTRPVRHPVGEFACRPCISANGPGLSGKAVVALTKIHTQGRGTITIIRTKG